MRRYLGPVLVGFGAFLLVLAVLLRFYAYPRLAVAPIDQNSVTKLEAKDATVFDISTLSEITTDLSVQSRTVGDVEASEDAGDNVRVWAGTTSIRSEDGTVRSRSAERAAFDAHSAEAVNCCGGFIETTDGERTEVKRSGLIYKFPFGTDKRDYKFWDSNVREAVTARFLEETEIDGLKVYEFEAVVPQTTTGTREVPASVLGEDGTDNIEADTTYANTRTFFVDPVTGAIIDRIEEQRSTLAYEGEDRVTMTEATLEYTDAQVQSNVDEYRSKASLLSLVHGLLPIVLSVLGIVLIVIGAVLSRRRERVH